MKEERVKWISRLRCAALEMTLRESFPVMPGLPKNLLSYAPIDTDCPGHKLPIIDWEIGQAYRDWRYKYKIQEQLLQKIRQRWLDLMCSEKNDVYFYVGNMKRFHNEFMVLGVFYPKK